MLESFQLPALALPNSDRVLDELKLAVIAEVGDRKDGLEDGLKTKVFSFRGKQVHLKEPLVRLPLDLDEVRDRDEGANIREIDSFPIRVDSEFTHLFLRLLWPRQPATATRVVETFVKTMHSDAFGKRQRPARTSPQRHRLIIKYPLGTRAYQII
jgi:hypothetical protein